MYKNISQIQSYEIEQHKKCLQTHFLNVKYHFLLQLLKIQKIFLTNLTFLLLLYHWIYADLFVCGKFITFLMKLGFDSS